jgi:hypothetical protein
MRYSIKIKRMTYQRECERERLRSRPLLSRDDFLLRDDDDDDECDLIGERE